jgi:hypothetical protein
MIKKKNLESEKKQIIRDINEIIIDTDYLSGAEPYPIDTLLSNLNESKGKGATHIKFNGTCEWDNPSNVEEVFVQCVQVDLETDEEFKERLKVLEMEKSKKELALKEIRRLNYEILKNEFENE